jgi:hypothetical protein
MITYYQPWLKPFLGKKKTATKPYLYYHSFEDALWDVLKKRDIPKKSVLLVPDFYCQDVLDNIKSHGYRYTLYSLNEHFQPNLKEFSRLVKTVKPQAVVVFHACGITSTLTMDWSWTKHIQTNTLIIEDCVHRLINPSTVSFINNNHYVIDSLRKVSPLPGSRIFGTRTALEYLMSAAQPFSWYTFKSYLYYFCFRLTLKIGYWTKSGSLSRWAHEVVLKKHDDVIGDSIKPFAGLWLFKPFIDRFNYKKLELLKKKQVQTYDALIKGRGPLYKVAINNSDYPLLHVYPVGLNDQPSMSIIEQLKKIGAEVWFKFPESRWSQNRSVLFLPLGFHVTHADIRAVARVLNST